MKTWKKFRISGDFLSLTKSFQRINADEAEASVSNDIRYTDKVLDHPRSIIKDGHGEQRNYDMAR